MNPTAEQAKAIELFLTGKPLAIEAGAGTGKTSTLVMLAKAAPERRGQYVAFNRAIVTDASAKMPANVACNTAHSLAFRAVGRHMKHRLDQPRQKSMEVAAKLGIGPLQITGLDGKSKTMAAGFLAAKVMTAIGEFCKTADPEPTDRHIAYIDGIDQPNETTGRRTYANNDRVRRHLRPYLAQAWADLSSKNGTLPYRHEHYLKLWERSEPKIDAEFILFDEAQDASPVMLSAVAQQKKAQVVFVGDSQQQIYEFTGAINALADLPVEAKAYLTQSFRFGDAIAEQANAVLDRLDAELRLRGWQEIASSVGAIAQPTAYLTRTNAAAVRRLLGCMEANVKAHLVGGGAEVMNFAEAAIDLQQGRGTNHPELSMFDSWPEVVAYATQEEEGADLLLMVKLIEEFTAAAILDALRRMPSQRDADLTISTAHKAKGLEWDSVKLADDFNTFLTGKNGDKEPQPAELRLLYVAVTRAHLRLDISAISLLGGEEAAPSGPSPEDVAAALATLKAEMESAAFAKAVLGEQAAGGAQEPSAAPEPEERPQSQPAISPAADAASAPEPCEECRYRRGHAAECSHRAAYMASLGARA